MSEEENTEDVTPEETPEAAAEETPAAEEVVEETAEVEVEETVEAEAAVEGEVEGAEGTGEVEVEDALCEAAEGVLTRTDRGGSACGGGWCGERGAALWLTRG